MTERFAARLYAIIGLLLIVPTLFGCAAVKATEQPPKRNLGVLDAGVPRTHVIGELGAPTWSDERDGETVDVVKFKHGYAKETKAVRALAHGAADVATLGLWEVVGIPFETIADGTEVQVEVHYGPDQKVASVNVIEGDQVVHPKPNLLARAFGGKHVRTTSSATAGSTRPGKARPAAIQAFEEDSAEVSTARATSVANEESPLE